MIPMAQLLIVDDEPSLRTSLRFLFEDEGYEVLEAADGLEGLDKLRSSTGSMVVMLDYLMPGRNGGEIMCDLVADPHLRDGHAFLMLTAQKSYLTVEQQAAMDVLHIPLISKPFDMDVLLDTVAQAAEGIPEVSS